MEEKKLLLLEDEPEYLKFFVEEAAKKFVNGGMEFGFFLVPENSPLRKDMRNRFFKEIFYELITSKEFRDRFPELELDPKYDISKDMGFEHCPALQLDGKFTTAFSEGGAYERMKDTLKAKKMGNDLVKCLFQERYDDLIFHYSYENWTEEFWIPHASFVIFDKKYSKL